MPANSVAESRAVSTVMLKGGTTKSTITANTAEALGRAGHEVLVIDTDPNGHLTANVGLGELYYEAQYDLGDVILLTGTAEPREVVQATNLGFDVLPSNVALETIETRLKDEVQPSLCLKKRLIDPLLATGYDYILIDTHSSRNTLVNNAVVAAPNLLLPVTPEHGITSGLTRTHERIIHPLREQLNLEVLAVVPNKLSQRIDHRTRDRVLIERICCDEGLAQYVPQFAYIGREGLDAIDAGQYDELPKPGIRKDADLSDSFEHHKTLGAYNPTNFQLQAFDELAAIIERGEVAR